MATKYEGIVIELGADTSDLQSAMRQVNSAASKTQKELNQIKTALKFNPGNMTLLAQQTGQLSNKVEQTKDRLKVLRSQLQAMSQDQSKIGTDEWDKLQREIIQTESKLESYEAQLKQAERAQQSASTSLGQLSAKMQANADRFRDIGSSIRNVGVGMTAGLTVPLVAAGSQAVSTAATFDDAMSQVSGALGDAGADMDGLRTLALQLGADTVFSATEAGQAMVELAKGGLTEADIKSGALEASMNLAAAGGLELATAANASVDGRVRACGWRCERHRERARRVCKRFVRRRGRPHAGHVPMLGTGEPRRVGYPGHSRRPRHVRRRGHTRLRRWHEPEDHATAPCSADRQGG